MRLSRRFKSVNMNGCVLYLPFYAYGANAQKAWDMSGQGNHGVPTGVVPGSELTLIGINKVTNGTFASDTGWTKGTDWTIASNKATKVAGTASDLEQDVSVVAGKQYYVFAYYTRTAGTITPQLGGTDGTTYSASAIKGEVIRATTTGNLKYQASADFAGSIRHSGCYEIGEANETLGWKWDGLTNSLTIPDFLETGNSAKELSALIWVYPENEAETFFGHAGLPSQYGWIFQRLSSSPSYADLSAFITFLISTDGTAAAGAAKYYTSSLKQKAFSWGLQGFTFNNGTLDLYIQGVLDPSPTKTWDPAITTIHNSTADILVLNDGKGLVGEVLLFNRALSTQEHRDYFEVTRSRYGV